MRETPEEVVAKILKTSAYEPELRLIRKDLLVYARHNDNVVFYSSARPPRQKGYVQIGHDTEFWYTAMTREEFLFLNQRQQLNLSTAYLGVAGHHQYVFNGYFDKAKSDDTHLIEFYMLTDRSLYDEIMQLDLNDAQLRSFRMGVVSGLPQPKAEGGGTFGLGHAGFKGGAVGRLWNGLLQSGEIAFRLVDLKLRNPFAA